MNVTLRPARPSGAGVRSWILDELIPSGRVTVAKRESTIVGMMAVFTDNGVSWIDQLYVSPEVVGKGIGTRMLAFAMEGLGPPIRLQTFQENAGARRFYERHGFLPILFSDRSEE